MKKSKLYLGGNVFSMKVSGHYFYISHRKQLL